MMVNIWLMGYRSWVSSSWGNPHSWMLMENPLTMDDKHRGTPYDETETSIFGSFLGTKEHGGIHGFTLEES